MSYSGPTWSSHRKSGFLRRKFGRPKPSLPDLSKHAKNIKEEETKIDPVKWFRLEHQ
jgi:hypothetical protein